MAPAAQGLKTHVKGGNTRHALFGLLIAGVFLAAPRLVSAATLSVSPTSGQFGVGQQFSVTIRVNSQGAAINAVEGTLTFNPDVLQVVSLSKAGSIFNLNVQEPVFSNTAGTVTWAGVILNPGFNGSSGNLLTINFKGIAPGTGQLSLASAVALANDGAGTNVLTGTSGAAYTIGAAPSPTQAPVNDLEPQVTSSTHPDPAAWYSNVTPVFEWTLPVGVDAVSYLLNAKADANPGNRSDGLISSVTFTDVPDGATYFHIRFRRRGAWGPIAHFPVRIDTQPPLPFVVSRVDADPYSRQPQLAYAATDTLSGVVRYAMQVDGDTLFDVPPASPGQPFTMSRLSVGTHAVTVRAFDAAGNAAESITTLTIAGTPWLSAVQAWLLQWGWVVLVLIALVLAYALGLSHGSGRLQKTERRSRRTLDALVHDIDDELAVLKKLMASRPLYPEEKYLRTELMHYRKNLKGFVGTHRHLAKKK